MKTLAKYTKDTFDQFALHLSEGGKTHVIKNRAHDFIGFVMPLCEMPELALKQKWASAQEDFNLDTKFLGWLFFYQYALEAWRISNQPTMYGNLKGLPPNVRNPRRKCRNGSYSWGELPRAENRFELSLHDSEITKIDAATLKKFAVSVFYDVKPYWPVNPWKQEVHWSYQWTPKGESHLDENKDMKYGGYLSWEQAMYKKEHEPAERKPYSKG